MTVRVDQAGDQRAAAAILAEGRTTLHNVPVLQDVFTFANVLRVTGCHVEFDPDADAGTPDTMVIDAGRVGHPEAPYELVNKMRASFYMLGALLGRRGRARVSLPGGCAWGRSRKAGRASFARGSGRRPSIACRRRRFQPAIRRHSARPTSRAWSASPNRPRLVLMTPSVKRVRFE